MGGQHLKETGLVLGKYILNGWCPKTTFRRETFTPTFPTFS
jgi:hypothetical protein